MTPEQIKRMEQIAKTFQNLSVSGPASAGFPKFDKDVDPVKYLGQLEKAHDSFTIRGGKGVNVQGSMKTGFSVNVKCGEGVPATGGIVPVTPPPVEAVCPDSDTTESITVEFAGGSLCDCVFSEFFNQFVRFEGNLERTVIVPVGSIGVLWRGSNGFIDIHSGPEDCTTGFSDTASYFCDITCDSDGWEIFGRCGAGMFFHASGSPPFPSTGTTLDSDITGDCGVGFPVIIAHEGTATISW